MDGFALVSEGGVVRMLVVVCVAAAVALLTTPLVIRIANRLKLYDQPGDRRHIHERPVPRLGGVAVFLATVTALVVAAAQTPLGPSQQRFLLAIFLAGGSVFIVGLIDDLKGLRALTKLMVECAAAILVCLLGLEIDVVGLGPAGTVATGHLAMPLTVLWIVGVTNAFNLVDGLDGLATGIAVVASATTLAASLTFGNVAVVIGCVALLGSLIGFGRYNLPPARIFLGDSGSLFIGFFLAVLSIDSSIKSTTVVLFVVPLCALAVPLIDMSLAIIRRWLRGSPIFVADARHIHHRLLARGLTPRAVTVVLVVASSLFALVAMSVLLAPHQAQLQIGLLGGLIVVTVAVSGIRQLKYDEFSEAASALSDVLRSRRVVNELIRAREATERMGEAGTIEQLNTVLHESAIAIGLRNIEVVPTEVALDIAHYNASVPPGHTWTFHCPVAGGTMGSSDHFLTITGDARHEGSLYGAERLAESLVPRLEAWFARATAMRIDADIARASGNVVLRADAAPEHSLDDVDLAHVPLGTPNRSRARSRGMSSANDFPISRAGPPSSSGPAHESVPNSA